MEDCGKKQFSVYTDLALEIAETAGSDFEWEKSGVKMDITELSFGYKLTEVEILNETGSQEMGKPIGRYITIEGAAMKGESLEAREAATLVLAEQIKQLTNLKNEHTVLIVGLGNWNVSPDALGPRVVKKTLVTRAMLDLPEEIGGRLRTVAAISPGVMGLTGIETGEIVKGVAEHVKPGLIILIDALAARKVSRINSTIQLSDTGIAPGAGIGNKRMVLNKQSLGCNVLAIGVPTVVDAATLANDTLDLTLDAMRTASTAGSSFYQILQDISEEERYSMIKSLLEPYAGNMFVTPKDVDTVVNRLSTIIADALNYALHPSIDKEDFEKLEIGH